MQVAKTSRTTDAENRRRIIRSSVQCRPVKQNFRRWRGRNELKKTAGRSFEIARREIVSDMPQIVSRSVRVRDPELNQPRRNGSLEKSRKRRGAAVDIHGGAARRNTEHGVIEQIENIHAHLEMFFLADRETAD